jgi:hypothetical protein
VGLWRTAVEAELTTRKKSFRGGACVGRKRPSVEFAIEDKDRPGEREVEDVWVACSPRALTVTR